MILDNSLLSLQIPEDAILFPTERIVSALEFKRIGRSAQAEGVGYCIILLQLRKGVVGQNSGDFGG